MASLVEAGDVFEPVRPWPDRTMRAQVREEMPGSETAAPCRPASLDPGSLAARARKHDLRAPTSRQHPKNQPRPLDTDPLRQRCRSASVRLFRDPDSRVRVLYRPVDSHGAYSRRVKHQKAVPTRHFEARPELNRAAW
jgi:hypothetical protein